MTALLGHAKQPTVRQDPAEPVDIGCGKLLPVRSSRFAAILDYSYDPIHAPNGAEDKPFEFNCIVVTTRGQWQFHGAAGKADVDSDSLMVGVTGDNYGCEHYRKAPDANLVVALRVDALDWDTPPIFDKQIVPANGAFRLVQRAALTINDDRFDSLIFTLFDEASKVSTRWNRAVTHLRMQRAKRFLELHAFEQIRLTDLASELGLSPFTTVRQFRAATGQTPYSYLLDLRLARAKELLSKSNASIRTVAQRVGFEDMAHFSHFFKQHTGCSPSAYRTT